MSKLLKFKWLFYKYLFFNKYFLNLYYFGFYFIFNIISLIISFQEQHELESYKKVLMSDFNIIATIFTVFHFILLISPFLPIGKKLTISHKNISILLFMSILGCLIFGVLSLQIYISNFSKYTIAILSFTQFWVGVYGIITTSLFLCIFPNNNSFIDILKTKKIFGQSELNSKSLLISHNEITSI